MTIVKERLHKFNKGNTSTELDKQENSSQNTQSGRISLLKISNEEITFNSSYRNTGH